MHEPTPDWRDEHNAEARWQGMHTAAYQAEAISWAEVLQVEDDYKRWRAANLFGALGSDQGPVDETTPQDQKPTTLVELLRKVKRDREAAPKIVFEKAMEFSILENLFFRET